MTRFTYQRVRVLEPTGGVLVGPVVAADAGRGQGEVQGLGAKCAWVGGDLQEFLRAIPVSLQGDYVPALV